MARPFRGLRAGGPRAPIRRAARSGRSLRQWDEFGGGRQPARGWCQRRDRLERNDLLRLQASRSADSEVRTLCPRTLCEVVLQRPPGLRVTHRILEETGRCRALPISRSRARGRRCATIRRTTCRCRSPWRCRRWCRSDLVAVHHDVGLATADHPSRQHHRGAFGLRRPVWMMRTRRRRDVRSYPPMARTRSAAPPPLNSASPTPCAKRSLTRLERSRSR